MKRIAPAFLLLACSLASASDWVLLYTRSNSIGDARIYLDKGSITTDGDIRTAWFKTLWSDSNYAESERGMNRQTYDCKRRTSKVYEIRTVYKGGIATMDFRATAKELTNWITPTPGSNEEIQLIAVCLLTK